MTLHCNYRNKSEHLIEVHTCVCVCARVCVSDNMGSWITAGTFHVGSQCPVWSRFWVVAGSCLHTRHTSVVIATTNTGTVATKPGCPVWFPERLGIPDTSLANQMVTYGYPICCKPMRCLSCATLTRATADPTGRVANGGTAASAMLLYPRKRVGSTESKRPADLLKQ